MNTVNYKREAWPVLVLVILSMVTMVILDRPLIRGDGVAYLAWLDTFVRDRDIDLTNQAERFQVVNTYQITWDYELERYVNIFPFGVGFVQAPFYAGGAALTRLGWPDQNPGYFIQMQGVQQGYSLALMAGANLMALAAIIIAWYLARFFVDRWTAVLVAWGLFVGTPLLYYSTVSPLNSHNPGAFLVACLILLLIQVGAFRTEEHAAGGDPSSSAPIIVWIALGVVAGLMVLVRWQLLIVAMFSWGLLAWQRRWKGLTIATMAAAIAVLPLPLVWNTMFGKPFVVPYDETSGQDFLGIPKNAHRVFLRIFEYSPMLLLSLLGIPFLWRKNREWALLAVTVIGTEILINGSTKDWYSGDSFGARRMSELYGFYVLLAAALIDHLPPVSQLRCRWFTRPVIFRVLLGVLSVYSILFLLVFLVFRWTNPDGYFADSAQNMITYFFDHPDPINVIDVIFHTHLGPRAWSMPGP